MNIESVYISAGTKLRRGPSIWASSGNVIAPVCYLRRPVWLHPDDFKLICESIRLELRPGLTLRSARREQDNQPQPPNLVA